MGGARLVREVGRVAGVGALAALLRYFYVNVCLFGGERVALSGTGFLPLYLGGIPLEQSFDFLAIGMQMLVTALETVVLVSDLHHGMMENLGILLCRFRDRRALYRRFAGRALLRNGALVLTEYGLLLLLDGARIGEGALFAQLAVLLTLFAQNVALEFLYFAADYAFRTTYGYVAMLFLYFSPVVLIGFLYASGSGLWRAAGWLWLQRGIYNWFHGFSAVYEESGVRWDAVALPRTARGGPMADAVALPRTARGGPMADSVALPWTARGGPMADLAGDGISLLALAALSLCFYWVGETCFRKSDL